MVHRVSRSVTTSAMRAVNLLATLALLTLLARASVSLGDLRHLHAFLANSEHELRRRYRPHYHLSAPQGWLHGPAAFLHYRRKYHLFYQYHPFDGAWGPTAWGHAVSSDLAHWAHYPPALMPRDPHDRHGCLAGSALAHDGYLTLFYTGHALVGNRTRSTISVAVSGDAVLFQKYLYNPVLRESPSHATELRDPAVWRHHDRHLMLVGASIARRGHLVLYTSPDLYTWRYNGSVSRSLGDMGTAWESPDLFQLDGMCVLLLSALGVRPDGDRFRNLRQSGYVLGERDCDEARIGDLEVSTATFEELDRGHDFQAARTTRAVDGRRLLVAWLGSWEGRFEEGRDGWAGVVTLVRELRVGRRGRLLQAPARELTELRVELAENARYSPGEYFEAGARAFELLVNASSAAEDVEMALEWSGTRGYVVRYQAARGTVEVDRGGKDGVRRSDWAPNGPLQWRIFVDRSSVEVFCGAGEVVFSSRIYPRGEILVRVGGAAQLHVTQYRLKRSVGYDNKIRKYIKDHYLNKYDED